MKFKYYLRGAGFGIITATIILTIAFLFQDTMTDAEIMRRASELGMVMENKGAPETLADVSKNGASQADLETAADDNGKGNGSPDDPAETDTDPADHDPAQSGSVSDSKTQSDPIPDKSDADPEDAAGSSKDTDQNKDKNQNTDQKKDTGQKKDSGKTDLDKTTNKDQSSQNADAKDKGSNNASDSKKETDDGKVTITIESGDVSRIVSGKVKEAGLVDDETEFNAFLGSNGYDNQLQPGTYEIEKGLTFRQIADILTAK